MTEVVVKNIRRTVGMIADPPSMARDLLCEADFGRKQIVQSIVFRARLRPMPSDVNVLNCG